MRFFRAANVIRSVRCSWKVYFFFPPTTHSRSPGARELGTRYGRFAVISCNSELLFLSPVFLLIQFRISREKYIIFSFRKTKTHRGGSGALQVVSPWLHRPFVLPPPALLPFAQSLFLFHSFSDSPGPEAEKNSRHFRNRVRRNRMDRSGPNRRPLSNYDRFFKSPERIGRLCFRPGYTEMVIHPFLSRLFFAMSFQDRFLYNKLNILLSFDYLH